MAKYSQLNEEDIRLISQHYGLIITNFEALDGGAANSSYHLQTANGDYVLTVFDELPHHDVVRMGQILSWLIDHDFPTTNPLFQINGDIVLEYQGKTIMLKQYIVGHVTDDLDSGMLQQVGRAIAQLHQISVPDFLPNDALYGLDAYARFKGLHNDSDYEIYLTDRMTAIEEKFNSYDLPRAMIHGDVFADNVIFIENEFQAIIDFEAVCCYYKIFDLAMGILGMCSVGTTIDLDKARALIIGYEEIRELEKAERETLQSFTEYAAIATSCWRFWQYNIYRPDPQKANTHLEMVNIAKSVQSIPDDMFMGKIFS